MKKAQRKGSSNRFVLSAVYGVLGLTTSALTHATEIEIKPVISSTYTYIGEADFSGVNFDTPIEEGHQALLLSPGISMIATGPVWNGTWNLSHTNIKQLNSDIGDSSYSDVSLNNQFGFVKDRVVLSVNGSRRNQNIDQRFAGVSDPIFSQGEYIDVDSGTVGLTLKNKSGSHWQNSLSYNFTTTDYNENDLEETSNRAINLNKGDTQNAELRLMFGRQANKVRGSFIVNGNSINRDIRGRQDYLAASFNVQVPIWSSFDMVVNGEKSRNSIANNNFDSSNLDNEYYGAGLAWRFGKRSFVAVTVNKDSKGQSQFNDSEDFDDTFVGYRVVFEPSKRTLLSYQNSRRFYGESHNFSYRKTGNNWDINVGYSEDLGSTSRLVNEAVSAGVYSCNPALTFREACIPLSGFPEIPNPSRVYFEFFDNNYLIQEVLTLSKAANAQITYRGKKSTLTLAYSKGTQEFLELQNEAFGSEQDSEQWSVLFNHRMSRRTSFVTSVNETDVTSNGTSGNREGFQASIGLERRLTRKATGKLNIRRFDNDGNSGTQNRKDTRLELQYTYQF
ncbi:hypothetical protein GCM10009128_24200 [Psychrosphaera haliotis]|uniref:hypothetical protein n=1 Tax=Psychrosphaera haliotis TaxID=555083 RepID=UPI0031DCEF3F